jgi:predicted ATP-dependent serine protease
MFEIPYSQIKKTDLSADEIKFITEGLKKAEDGPYFEYDVNMEDPTPEYIDSKIRDLIASKGKPDLLVVDYIGNMTVRDAPKGAKDYELQSLAIKKLFTMAKRYNIPIITAQQINREAIRDARKAKENNKFMSFDQAAVSGGQVLMHLCTYAIAMEPNKEHGYCILHPVKMRDAHFQPFPVALNPDYNKIKELTKEEQEAIMGKHSALSGSTVSTVKSVPEETKTPMRKPKAAQEEEEEEFFEKVDISNDEELDLADWVLG